MLPGLSTQLDVYSATNSVIDHAPCVDPCVDDQARAGLEMVGLALGEAGVQGIEESGGRHLCRWIPRAWTGSRRGRVDGHARAVDEAHVGEA
jgi:hypothetical protein